MHKRDITYEDFNGNEVTETFYFNLTKSELVELEVNYESGLEAAIKRIIAANDQKSLIAEFKKLILLSYGQKSEDGRRFIKNDELRQEFAQTAAYDQLFIDLATSDDAATDFITGIVPKDMVDAIKEASVDTPSLPSPPAPPLAT